MERIDIKIEDLSRCRGLPVLSNESMQVRA
jgi:hypothetical protein